MTPAHPFPQKTVSGQRPSINIYVVEKIPEFMNETVAIMRGQLYGLQFDAGHSKLWRE